MTIQLTIGSSSDPLNIGLGEAKDYGIHFLTPDQIAHYSRDEISRIITAKKNDKVIDTKNNHPTAQDLYDMLGI